VPFIARYRKEATGSLDEVAVTSIRERLLEPRRTGSTPRCHPEIARRAQSAFRRIEAAVAKADSVTQLEDIYLPYRPKRRTRRSSRRSRDSNRSPIFVQAASHARSAGGSRKNLSALKKAWPHRRALAGARDIIAERVSDDANARARIARTFLERRPRQIEGLVDKQEAGAKFKDYFDWSEPVGKFPAIGCWPSGAARPRAFSMMRITVPEESDSAQLEPMFVTGKGPAAEQVRLAVQDSYKRLLGPRSRWSCVWRPRNARTRKPSACSPIICASCLLASPLGRKNVLAIDPGFRTGCKIVCLDRQGKLLHNDVIYPTASSPGKSAKPPRRC
jgi:uncharacterized protein